MTAKTPFLDISRSLLPYLLALCCTLAILGIHMLPNMDSMLNENNTQISHVFLKSQIDYHKEIAPFARRPLTTLLIEGSSQAFGIRAGHAFILVNFLLLLVSGVLVHQLSKSLRATKKQALLNMLVYFSSFSVLFAFFPPVFTYDEPLQYCFILGALIAFVQRKWLWYIVLFALALVTRETSMLLLPGFIFFISRMDFQNEKLSAKAYWRILMIVVSPLLIYSIFIGIYIQQNQLLEATQTEMASRYSCFLENFESTKNTIESFTSFFLSLGPFLYFALLALKKSNISAFDKRFLNAFLVTVAINTPIVILTSFARESRLFALPLVFLWPMFMQLFGRELKLIFLLNTYRRLFAKWQYAILLIGLNILNYWFCFEIYRDLGLGENTYFAEYLFVMNFCLIFHFLVSFFALSKVRGQNSDF